MNPYPFAPLNHFTVPFSIWEAPDVCCNPQPADTAIDSRKVPFNKNRNHGQTITIAAIHFVLLRL
jgi:hypothetical protein